MSMPLSGSTPTTALLRSVATGAAAESIPPVDRRHGAQPIYRALEGGGVRGIGHIGAAAVFDALPAQYQTVANVGTSAGADAAALLSSGIGAAEARRAIDEFPFAKVLSGDRLPVIGALVEAGRLIHEGGLHDGGALEKALTDTLDKYAGVHTFEDLYDRIRSGDPRAARLFITASDPGHSQLDVFPMAYSEMFGVGDAAQQSIAFAARASSSIPGFFAPALIRDAAGRQWMLGDGGVVAVLPYDEAKEIAATLDPDARVINFALGGPEHNEPIDPGSPTAGLSYLWKTFHTLAAGRRNELLADTGVLGDTVVIHTGDISSVEFNLTKGQQTYLYNSGVVSGLEFVLKDLQARGRILSPAEVTALRSLAGTARRELGGVTPGDQTRVRPDTLTALTTRLDAVSADLQARGPARAEAKLG